MGIDAMQLNVEIVFWDIGGHVPQHFLSELMLPG
jgi:hypothetical protein